MRAIATMEKKIEPDIYFKEATIRFEEGLIGFSDCKRFILMESDGIAPFRRLQSMDRPDVGFLVLDPVVVMKDYYSLIPAREWDSVELDPTSAKLAFAICIIGPSPTESTGNFQAPLIVNYKKMIGRQIILTDSGLTSRQPLL